MPLYEYACEKCGEKFEVMQKFSDEPLTTHESCGGPVHRLISAPALQFKGSGWYVTDYARSGTTPASDNGSASKSSKPADTPAAKSDSTTTPAPAASSTSSDSKSTPSDSK
jgi:putative FmdB family regulatory protein